MSIRWMTRIWASPVPSHPTDRLMLLALADNANDEGVCWPCVETLQRRCSLKTVRGARKVLERLEEGTFIERISRPGKSNVYQLREASLDTPERADRGIQNEEMPESDKEPPPEEPEKQEDMVAYHADLVELLEQRGVFTPVAQKLVERFGAGRVREQVEHYDYLCAHDERPRSPGWLVRAIEEGYPVPDRSSVATMLYTYHEMLAWCEERGDLSLTRVFTPVKQDGKTFFQLSRSTEHAGSQAPSSTDHHAPRSHQK